MQEMIDRNIAKTIENMSSNSNIFSAIMEKVLECGLNITIRLEKIHKNNEASNSSSIVGHNGNVNVKEYIATSKRHEEDSEETSMPPVNQQNSMEVKNDNHVAKTQLKQRTAEECHDNNDTEWWSLEDLAESYGKSKWAIVKLVQKYEEKYGLKCKRMFPAMELCKTKKIKYVNLANFDKIYKEHFNIKPNLKG